MNWWAVLRVMILKEWRTMVRERNQLLAMAVVVVVMSVAIGTSMTSVRRDLRRKATPATQVHHEAPPSRQAVMVARWVCIGIGAGFGLFFAFGYLVNAILASFVGEKEAKTLELLLATPLSDHRLYAAKCLSVLLPMAAMGYAFVLAGVIVCYAVFGEVVAMAPVNPPLYALGLSVPVLLLAESVFIGLGAAVSATAETTKGAGQVLGVVFFVIMFGGGYGIPLLVKFTSLRQPLVALGKAWLDFPFVVQYAMVLGVVGVPALICLAVGRASFKRDRLLT